MYRLSKFFLAISLLSLVVFSPLALMARGGEFHPQMRENQLRHPYDNPATRGAYERGLYRGAGAGGAYGGYQGGYQAPTVIQVPSTPQGAGGP